MTEIRNLREGSLRWVYASGSGLVWTTASAAASGLLGYVTNFTCASARTYEAVGDRGIPTHWKHVDVQPVTLSWDLLWGITANYPGNTSGSGASVPMIHVEFKATAPESGGGSVWEQYHGVVIDSIAFTESNPANTQTWTCRALAMSGPTGTGFMS